MTIQFDPAKIQLSPPSLFIYQPRYVNPNHTVVKAIVRRPSGELFEMEGDVTETKSPFIRDVFHQYSHDEILMNTRREEELLKKRKELELRLREDEERERAQDILAAAKAQALQMPFVQSFTNNEIRRKIRSASSTIEISSIVAALMIQSGWLENKIDQKDQ